MDRIEKTGKTVDDAVREALVILQATKEEVEIEVLEEPSKGFLGIGSKLAKVLVKRKVDPVSTSKAFLREIFAAMGIVVDINARMKDSKQLMIDLKGDDMGVLIGKRGQTLDSLQYLINLVVNKGEAPFVGVNLDTENYRQRRKETLESLASNLAKKVKATKKKVELEPMSAYERRVIHAVLQNDKYVSTHSEGNEPFRKVVITLKTSVRSER